METERKALVFSGIGAVAFLFILFTGPLYVVQNLTFVMVQVFGAILILWALLTRKLTKQDTEHKHHLPKGYFYVTKGPYEIIRHPIYAGFLLIVSSLVQYNFTIERIIAFLILIAMIVLKVIREEHTMAEEAKGYKEYQKDTKMLIPYFF